MSMDDEIDVWRQINWIGLTSILVRPAKGCGRTTVTSFPPSVVGMDQSEYVDEQKDYFFRFGKLR